MHISFGKNARDTVPVGKELSFEQFVKLVESFPIHTGRLTWSEYCAADKSARARDKDAAWFIPAKFVRAERRADAVELLSGFVCDFDDGAITRTEIGSALVGTQFIAWTSYSNGLSGCSKWRCYIPYDSPITPDRHLAVYEHFNKIFDGHLDPRCATTSQLWYLRGRPRGSPPGSLFVGEGAYFQPGHQAPDDRRPDAVVGGLPTGTISTLAARAAQDNNDLISRGPTSILDIKSALAALDPNLYEDYTEWLSIGMSIYDGTKGSNEGCDIFDQWSATVPGYSGSDSVRAKWYSFGGRNRLSRRTVASLFKSALDAGWSGNNRNSSEQPPVPCNAVQDIRLEPPAVTPSIPASHVPPVQLVLPLIVTAPVAPPDRFRAHPTAYSVQKKMEDPDTGNQRWVTCISGFRVLSLNMLKTIDEGRHSVELVVQNAAGTDVATFSAGETSAGVEFQGLLATKGIITTKDEFKSLQEMIVEWLKKIQDNNRIKRSFTHLGWMEKDTQHIGFALGTTAYYADGSQETDIKVETGGGSTIVKHYIPQGDLKTWNMVSTFLSSQNRPELMAVLSTAFGSPLMKFSGHSGAVVSIVSTASGVGKSTALSLAQSVWGNPKSAMHSAADTVLSLSSKMGFTKDLPAYWDDIKGEKTFEQFASTIYQITQGKEKSRLSQSAELREVQNWNCLAVVAANDSLIEITKRYGKGTDAGAARIFEIRLEQRPEMTQQATFFDICSTNYGRAGEVYAAWLAANPDKARTLVEKLSDHLHTELKVESEERFWVAAVAVMVAGAQIAKQLGLVDFDVRGLLAYLKNRFLELRGGKTQQMKELDAGPMVSDMILDHQTTTLRIEAMPFKNRTKPIITRTPKDGKVDIMIAEKESVLRIRKAKLTEWCRSRGHSSTTLIAKLEQAKALLERNTDPMAGASPYSANNRTTCYDIDLKTLGLQIGEDDVDPA